MVRDLCFLLLLCTGQGAGSSAEDGHTQHTRKGPGAVAASAPIPSLLRHRQGHRKDRKRFGKAADGSPGGQCQSRLVVLYLIVFWGFGISVALSGPSLPAPSQQRSLHGDPAAARGR